MSFVLRLLRASVVTLGLFAVPACSSGIDESDFSPTRGQPEPNAPKTPAEYDARYPPR
jgi:hypothetical protein